MDPVGSSTLHYYGPVERQDLGLGRLFDLVECASSLEPEEAERLEGRVLTTDGEPIADARVEFYSHILNAAHFVTGHLTIAESRADRKGYFHGPELPAEDVYLRISAPGFVSRSEQWIWRGKRRMFHVPSGRYFELFRPSRIRGVVLGTDGLPVTNATVYAASNPRYSNIRLLEQSAMVRTDRNGVFEFDNLPKGHHMIVSPAATLSRDAEDNRRENADRCAVAWVHLEEGVTVDNVILDLGRSTAEVSGVVLDSSGKPKAGAELHVYA
jgi:hypothetical protein